MNTQDKELYDKFVKALNITDYRPEPNPFVMKCMEIVEQSHIEKNEKLQKLNNDLGKANEQIQTLKFELDITKKKNEMNYKDAEKFLAQAKEYRKIIDDIQKKDSETIASLVKRHAEAEQKLKNSGVNVK